MWSESAGFEECAGDVVGEVAEAEGQATQVLEATVHGFGRSVARARPVEVGQDVAGASGQGAAELAQFYQRLRHTVGEGVDHGAHLDAAGCPVGVTVGGDHALVDPPGALDLHVPVPSEELVKALVLAVGEQVSPGVQGPPRGVERVALASAVSAAEEHVEVEATWGIYQRIVAAYREPDKNKAKEMMRAVIDSVSNGVPALLKEIRRLGRTLKQRAADILAFFDRPGTSNGPTEAINGRLEHLRGSALGFRNLTHYVARSLLEAGGFRPLLHSHSR